VTARAGKPPAIVVIAPAPVAPGIAVMACATQRVAKTPTIARSIVVVSTEAAVTACATFANTTIARAPKNAERAPEAEARLRSHAVVSSTALVTGSTK
jgi:hypothetical protein